MQSVKDLARCVMNGFLIFYQALLSPALKVFTWTFGVPCACRFAPTCSEFARSQIRDNPSLLRALWKILVRILSCNPFSSPLRKN